MWKALTMAMVAVGLVAVAPRGVAAQREAASPTVLTGQDYAEIQQLAARYTFAIDACTNNGYDYADLYTDDGEFSVSQAWGTAGARKTKGREALAQAAIRRRSSVRVGTRTCT